MEKHPAFTLGPCGLGCVSVTNPQFLLLYTAVYSENILSFSTHKIFGSLALQLQLAAKLDISPERRHYLSLFLKQVANLQLQRVVYRDRLKGLNVVARSLFLLLIACSAWRPCLGPA